MSLDEIEAEFVAAHEKGMDVARLHSGDLSIYSAVAEQVRRLERLAIPYTLTPGVPAFAAAAAVLGRELTVPELTQSVVLTRMPGRASAMPAGRDGWRPSPRPARRWSFIWRSSRIGAIVEQLTPSLWRGLPGRGRGAGELARRAHRARHARRDIAGQVAAEPIERTALVLVGRALAAHDFRESALYDPDYRRRFRGERSITLTA